MNYYSSFLLLIFLLLGITPTSYAQKVLEYEFMKYGGKFSGIKIQLDQKVTPQSSIDCFVGQLDTLPSDQTSVFGEAYYLEDNTIAFQPAFGLQPQLFYSLFLDKTKLLEFQVPATTDHQPEVLVVYPSSNNIPANLLKFYLHFSQPMQAGRSLNWIHLVDAHGDTLQSPFLFLQPELWNEDYTRLTLWLDPGRIKRDLGPNRDQGMPLSPGEELSLLIDANWQAQSGKELKENYKQEYQVSVADRTQPHVNNWRLELPSAGSSDPLKIYFGEALDNALLEKSVFLFNPNQNFVEGYYTITEKETLMTFTPEKTWEAGSYYLQVDANLEDLAGNNLNRLFDRDLFDENQKAEDRDYYNLEFEIRN